MRIASAHSTFMVRWLMLAVVLGFASLCSAQFPLPIPTRPTSFPLQRPAVTGGTVVEWGLNNDMDVSAPAGLSGVVQVAVGTQTLALLGDGTVVAWGDPAGRRGMPTDLSGVVQVAEGNFYSLALKGDGTVVVWGWNLGQPPAGLSGVVQVAAGRAHALALKSDGTVVAWGWYLGEPPAGLSGVVQVAAGGHHSLALKSDGTVVAWGANNAGQANVPAGLSGVVQVAASSWQIGTTVLGHSLALKSDGTVVAWGANDSGQANVPAGLSGVVQVAAGGAHSLALKSDGTVVAWGGADISGRYPPGGSPLSYTGMPAGLSVVVQVAVGDYEWRALREFDTDGDGLGDGAEANTHKTDPKKADTDGDGLGDGAEVNTHKTDPKKADTDGDGLIDSLEINTHGTDPKKADTDGDGLSDGAEANTHKTDPKKVDTDGDGLSDPAEINTHGTDPKKADTDSDGLSDGAEINTHKTDPKKVDTDGDGLPDGWEVANGTKPSASDAREDPDGDGLTNEQERQQGTLPKKADTDGDGLSDGAEVTTHKTDARKADTDGDGLSDSAEVTTHKTDARKADTDGDGLSDSAEVTTHKTDPKKADTDGDGLNDGAEVNTHTTDPKKADTDGDGLSDGAEANTHASDPKKADTDGDGLSDGVEVNTHKTDPKKGDTDGDGLSDGDEVSVHKTNPLARDTDGDWLPDEDEVFTHFTDPKKRDTDGDGLSDGEEVREHGTDPWKVDTDGDTMPDAWEVANGTKPSVPDDQEDIDNDDLVNGLERRWGTSPKKADSDGDGLSDGWEVEVYKTDPKKVDTDGDWLTDGAEVTTHKTDPKKADTDGDGLEDNAELTAHKTDPKKADTDGDGLKDGAEVNTHQTDPVKADTDRDGMPDGWEVSHGIKPKLPDATEDPDKDSLTNMQEYKLRTNPNKADTDGDGLSDPAEINTHKTDPTKADTDGDGLGDGAELNTHKTDPKKADTDNDGYSDGFEFLNLKSDPLRPNDTPAFVTVGDPKNPDEDGAGQDVENAGIGYVGEVFEIATTEVTNLMYARFLNAVAKSDTLYGLYTAPMGTDSKSGGIVRSGSSGNYTYNVKPGFANRPVNFVSLYDALRYINWLHNGMPNKSVQDSSTTENGAYKLLGANPRNVIRNAGAKFFLPDQDEWHKAAFFDPNPVQGRPSDTYWPFADQSVSGPGGGAGINVAATSSGASHYGTYDQGGNVREWTETVRGDSLQDSTEPVRSGERLIATGSRPMTSDDPTREISDLGFRVGRTLEIAPGNGLVTPALVRVGQEFNLGDDTNRRLGAVPYEFNMGTYEVSNAEYAIFLNAVAKTDTFFGLYNTRMGTDRQGGIMRSGQNGNFSYTVKPGFAKKPVNFVTVYSAMRFCNWLHNGARRNSETERGAYRLLGNIPPDTVTVRRSPAARFFLPTEDEYYKAAFYDPSPLGMPTASYWSFAVRSDVPTAQQINFLGAYTGLTDVDKPGGKSFFGTFGQSGNVAEWTETTSPGRAVRRVYGGHYDSSAQGVSALGAMEMPPLTQSATVGFRIAASQGWQTILPFAPIGPKTIAWLRPGPRAGCPSN